MSSEEGPHLGAPAQTDRLEVSNDLASPDDGEVLPTVLDGVEEIGEVAGCVSGADLWHEISDHEIDDCVTGRGCRRL